MYVNFIPDLEKYNYFHFEQILISKLKFYLDLLLIIKVSLLNSCMQGVESADSILFGVEEQTFFYPDHVNNRKETTRRFNN